MQPQDLRHTTLKSDLSYISPGGKKKTVVEVGLSNRSGRVGFVFGLKLNGLKTPQPEPDPFNKRVEKP